MIIHDNNVAAAMALGDPNNVEAYRTTILNGHDGDQEKEVRRLSKQNHPFQI